MKDDGKKFRLFDSVLMAVVVVLVVEAAAPAAAIGNSQFFWWILLLLVFFIPYGLVSAELGTTYEDTGGIYDWVKRAFGRNMGTRVAWYYWINFPLWMASLALLCTETLNTLIGFEINTFLTIVIQILFLLIVNVVGSLEISQSKWFINISAFFKAFIMLSLGAIAIYVAFTKGVSNEYTVKSLMPTFDINSISFISVIIFNFLGFEVVTTLASEMDRPKKQIPKAIVLGGVLIMVFYLVSAFGMGVAIPVDKLAVSSGLLDSFTLLLGSSDTIFIKLIGIIFIITLFANLISWSLGVNYVACHAAKNNSLPKFFAKESKDGKTPIGAAVANFVVSVSLVLVSYLIPNEEMFWNFFALNMITLLLSYVMIFPAFVKLRKIEKDIIRPFKVPGKELVIKLIAFVPMVVLVLAIFVSVAPLSFDKEELSYKLPILFGTVIAMGIAELIIIVKRKSSNKLEIEETV